MSTNTMHPATPDLPAVVPPRGITAPALVRLELRKAVDTRAAAWLLGLTLLGGPAAAVAVTYALGASADAFTMVWGMALAPAGLLLPVAAALLVTTEFTQRTSVVTFAVEPRRGRVLVAKAAAVLALTLVVAAVALVAAVAAVAALDGTDSFVATPTQVVGPLVDLLLSTAAGFAFGLLLRNTAAAACAYLAWLLVVPSVLMLAGMWWQPMADLLPWIDASTARGALAEPAVPGAVECAQMAVTAALWTLLPGAVGWWSVSRGDLG